METVERMHWILVTSEVIDLFTDRHNLIFLFHPLAVVPDLLQTSLEKSMRGAGCLSIYNYTCVHIKGCDNVSVDILVPWSPSATVHRLANIPVLPSSKDEDFVWSSRKKACNYTSTIRGTPSTKCHINGDTVDKFLQHRLDNGRYYQHSAATLYHRPHWPHCTSRIKVAYNDSTKRNFFGRQCQQMFKYSWILVFTIYRQPLERERQDLMVWNLTQRRPMISSIFDCIEIAPRATGENIYLNALWRLYCF